MSKELDPHLQHFETLCRFMQILAHQVRSPLSVIVTELKSIESQLGASECRLALESTTKINTLLIGASLHSSAGGCSLLISKVSIRELIKEAGFSLSSRAEGATVLCDIQKSVFALKSIGTVLQESGDLQGGDILVEIEGGELLKISWENDEVPQASAVYNSFSSWLLLGRNLQSIRPVLIDAILKAQRCSVSIEPQKKKMHIAFPIS